MSRTVSQLDVSSLLLNLLRPVVVATHRFTADEGDWGFTRFYDLRSLFSDAWEGKGVPLVQDEEAKITAYVRVVKDPTGVLWHNFNKYAHPSPSNYYFGHMAHYCR